MDTKKDNFGIGPCPKCKIKADTKNVTSFGGIGSVTCKICGFEIVFTGKLAFVRAIEDWNTGN